MRVRVVREGTGALLERLRRPEGRDADVLWGGGAESLVANIDLFRPYLSPERAAVPAELRDEAGLWTGFSVLPMVIIYNQRLVPPERAPRRWSDLASKDFKGGVAYADPATSGSAYTILRTMLAAFRSAAAGSADPDEAAWRAMERFVGAIGGQPLAESTMVYRGVASGEYLAGATYENAGADARRLGSDVGVAYPLDGTSAVPDGIALLAWSSRAQAAERFVDFALGLDVAKVSAARFGRRSARGDAPVPEGLPPLSEIRILDYDFDAAVAERALTLGRFKSLTSRP